MTRTLIIVNPASAGGKTAKRWSYICSLLTTSGVTFDTHLTSRPGDATVQTRRALSSGYSRIVVVGGDGTLNEVVNGFYDEAGRAISADAVLALLPSGTGGDFRKTAGISTDHSQSVALLNSGMTKPVDVGRIDFGDGSRRFFINIADCGIGGEVVARVNRSTFKGGGARGMGLFLGISLSALLTFGSRPVELELDGERLQREVQNVVIGNGRYFGGGMKVAPEADLRDGLFDVVIIKRMSRTQSLLGMGSIYRGTHLRRPQVEFRRAREVKISARGPRPLLFDVEGEQVGRAPATLTCLPAALHLCMP